jgi:ATP/maltotriose-dependent transcriptional regulator MalT
MLDGSKARIRLLVGAAGYGKTTLAEQWAARPERRVGWARCRRSSSDIAVVSRLIAAAGATILPGCERRLEQRLSVTPDPSREADVLAEILAEDLEAWPTDAWIVIDDYHFTMEAPAAERFVEVVAEQSPLQLLIASRHRPSWVTSRALIYGHVLEIDQPTLAMDNGETLEILGESDAHRRKAIASIAEGWPAVLALASLLPDQFDPHSSIPPALLGFLADEVLRSLDPGLQEGLSVMALLPSVDRDLLGDIVKGGRRERFLAGLLDSRLVEERDGRLDLHPLVASFFASRATELSDADVSSVVRIALSRYSERQDWDNALELVERHAAKVDVAPLIRRCLDPLLDSARVASLQHWIEAAQHSRPSDPYVLLAQAEIAFRQGSHLLAESFGESARGSAEPTDDEVRIRAMLVSGRAAHAGSRESEALAHYRHALAAARHDLDRLAALHGLVMSAAALEDPSAHRYMSMLEERTDLRDAQQRLRLVDRQLSLGLRFGSVRNLAEASKVSTLLTRVRDPLARCSFRSMYSCALALGAHYEEALEQALALEQDAQTYRLQLALPYAYATSAAASAGQHRYADAHAYLNQAEEASRRCRDEYGLQNVYAIRTRVLLQEGRVSEACALEPPETETAIPSMWGEVRGSRALALASIGKLDDARALARDVRSSTQAVEAKVLAQAVAAICALRSREADTLQLLSELIELSFESGGVDLVVASYRSCPDLLSALLSLETTRERTVFLLSRAGDETLGSDHGARPSERLHPQESLSPREREVCDFVCHGVSNPEIARTLFISEATVKAHLHKVYEKVGVHSRGALISLLNQTEREKRGV